MKVADDELEAVGQDARAVIRQAKEAGVYVFGGGINDTEPTRLVAADGTVTAGGYPGGPQVDGGFTILELPSAQEAMVWAARLARACRCQQELRVFGFDPES